MRSNSMAETLPRFYQRDAWVQALFSVCEPEVQARLLDAARQLRQDMTLAHMSERQLIIEERLCGIVPPMGATLDDRKAAVSARWRTASVPTLKDIRAICAGWNSGAADATYLEGRIKIKFTGIYGVPRDLDSLKSAVEAICPAHIPVDYVFTYKLWRDYNGSTWADKAEMTWLEARGGT